MRGLLCTIGLGLLIGLAGAGRTSPAWADGLSLAVQRVDAAQFPIVRLYVSAATGEGIPIAGLDARAFELREEDKPVEGLLVEPIIDSQEPIASALVVDTSGSMADEGKLESAKAAAGAFVDALGASDSVTVVSFATHVKVVQEYTGDKAALKNALTSLVAQGDTLLYDAIAQTARRQAQQAQRRKALIVLTDGEDTKSAESLRSSVSAAQAASSPIFVIGLGSDVKKEVLDTLATMTGGQAIYVSDAGLLRQTFLSIGDQLRRQYALQYTSHLAPDDKPHPLSIKLSYTGGQQATGQAVLTIPKLPPPPVINGLSSAGPVQGPQHINVDAPGGTQLVQLLVDDQPRARVATPPFAFDWDATRETPGQHRVVVRVVDAQNQTSEKAYIVTVAAPPPTPTAVVVPTLAPTAAAVGATPLATSVAPVVASAPPTTAGGPNWVVAAVLGALFLLLAALAAGFYFTSRRRAAPAAAGAPARPAVNDDTEMIGASLDAGEATFVRVRPPVNTTARLRIARRGVEHEVTLDGRETTIGRGEDVSIPIRDEALASRMHARILREDGQFWLEDLRSLNGTQVNGEAVTRRQLANNDRVTIGETTLTFVVETRGGDPPYRGGAR